MVDPEIRTISNRLRANKRFWVLIYGGLACFVIGLFVHRSLAFLTSGLLFFVGGMLALWYGGDIDVSLDHRGRLQMLTSAEDRSHQARTVSARAAGVVLTLWGLGWVGIGVYLL